MKSMTSTPVSPPPSDPSLPPYLCNTEPMEPAEIPLQLALLTMEVAAQRQALGRLAQLFNYTATMIQPASFNNDG